MCISYLITSRIAAARAQTVTHWLTRLIHYGILLLVTLTPSVWWWFLIFFNYCRHTLIFIFIWPLLFALHTSVHTPKGFCNPTSSICSVPEVMFARPCRYRSHNTGKITGNTKPKTNKYRSVYGNWSPLFLLSLEAACRNTSKASSMLLRDMKHNLYRRVLNLTASWSAGARRSFSRTHSRHDLRGRDMRGSLSCERHSWSALGMNFSMNFLCYREWSQKSAQITFSYIN